jgi:hypothetical protein
MSRCAAGAQARGIRAMWLVLWLKFLEWWNGPEVVVPVFSQADLDAIAAMTAPPKEGWYAWECAQYRASGAPWFDPRRYDGSPLAFHRPTVDDLISNYEGSMDEAVREYGQEDVDAATWWVYQESKERPEMEAGHRESLDPIGWCVEAYRKAGSPLMKGIPREWSPAAQGRSTRNVQRRRRAEPQHSLSAYQNALSNYAGTGY